MGKKMGHFLKKGKKWGIPAPKRPVFQGAVGFVANAPEISTKFRNYGISNFGRPKVGTLGHFFKDDEKKGPSRPQKPRFWRRGWLRSQRAQNFYEIPKSRNFKFWVA